MLPTVGIIYLALIVLAVFYGIFIFLAPLIIHRDLTKILRAAERQTDLLRQIAEKNGCGKSPVEK